MTNVTVGHVPVSGWQIGPDNVPMLRELAAKLSSLRKLTMTLSISLLGTQGLDPDINVTLNPFRPLCKLPLENLVVKHRDLEERSNRRSSRPWHASKKAKIEKLFQIIEPLVKSILLQDPNLPEEPQARHCQDQIQRWKEEHRAFGTLGGHCSPGVVIAG